MGATTGVDRTLSRLRTSDFDPEGGAADGITVTDITDSPSVPPAAGVLGSVLGVYEQHGFDAGYRRAVRDVLPLLLSVTEQLIRDRAAVAVPPDGPAAAAAAADLRRVAWAVHEELERRLAASAEARSSSGEVEGGLGI